MYNKFIDILTMVMTETVTVDISQREPRAVEFGRQSIVKITLEL